MHEFSFVSLGSEVAYTGERVMNCAEQVSAHRSPLLVDMCLETIQTNTMITLVVAS